MDIKKDQHSQSLGGLDTVTVDLAGIHPGPDGVFDDSIMSTSIIGTGIYNTTAPNWTIGTGWTTAIDTVRPNAKLNLTGEDADIDVNGISLMKTLRTIEDQLNILRPDASMEAEWQELREIRLQYEAKLAECKEKSQIWKALKK